MNLLYLAHRIPYPPNKGDKIRSWNELRYLAARHTVHLGCLVDEPSDMQHVETLRRLVASMEAVRLDVRRARLRSLVGLVQPGPLSVRYFSSPRLQRYVDRVLASQPIDAIVLFSSPMAAYVAHSDRPLVVDFCDVDSDKWRQYAERAGQPRRSIYAIEARRLRRYEIALLERCRAATLVTHAEKELWADLPPALRDKVHVVPNGVDLEHFAPGVVAQQREPRALVFTGAMDYFANVDAVTWFADAVLPRIQAVYADAVFYVVGSNPAPAVQALASRRGVVVTGFVDDIRGHYARAALCVVPLRIARGIQNKVLEAMAMGRPVLTTEPAFAGLGAEPDAEVCVAADAEAFAARAIQLLGDPVRAESMGRAGRAFVEREYVWERSMRRFEALLQASHARAAELVSV
jgi:sugar transferase (PEP-CTERM/EpsH1 system associated)